MREINFEASRLARKAADEVTAANREKDGRWRLVAGAIGPTTRAASISPKVEDPGFRNVTYMELKDSYKEQLHALVDGGCHVVFIETIFDTLNARAAIYAYQEFYEEDPRPPLPLVVSTSTLTKLDLWNSDRHGRKNTFWAEH